MIVVTARRRAESLIDVPIAITAYSGEQLENEGALDITDIGDTTPNVTLEASRAHQFDADRLHPRRRPAGSGRRLRGGRRHLSRRRLSQPSAGGPARHLQCRADRGAARAAGHALRPQHDRRRDQICHPPAAGAIPSFASAARSAPTSRPIWSSARSTPVSDDRHAARRRARSRGCRATASARTSPPAWTITTATSGPGGSRSSQQRGQCLRPPPGRSTPATTAIQRGGHRLIPALVLGAPVLDDVYDTRGGLLDPEQKVRAGGVSLYAEVQPWDDWTLRSITAYRRDRQQRADRLRRAAGGRRRRAGRLPQPADLAGAAGSLQQRPVQRPARRLLSRRQCRHDLRRAAAGRGHRAHLRRRRAPRPSRSSATSPTISPTCSASRSAAATPGTSAPPTSCGAPISAAARPSSAATASLFATTSDFNGTADFEEFTPRASVSFHPAENQTIYASYSRRLQRRRLRSARPDHRLPDPDRRRLQRAANLRFHRRSIRRRSTATSSATAPRCSTGASTSSLVAVPCRL